MIRMFILALGCGVVLTGCMAEVLTTTAIRGQAEAQQLGAMQRQLGFAKDTTDEANLRHALDLYKADKGVNPPSLDALVPQYIASIPVHANGQPYGYDPASGVLLDGPVANSNGPTPQDQQTMIAIRNAINAYGTAVGYYPETLDALAPRYLPTPPRTSAGESFLYNNQNGAVTHPRAGQRNAPRPASGRSGGGVGGAGPLGEAMTGIGIQNQLNSMGNSGANSAGNRSRNNVRGLQTQQNDKVNNTLNNLGL